MERSQSVKAGDEEHVPSPKLGENPRQLRPTRDSATDLFLKNLLRTGGPQLFDLSIKRLSVRRHSGVPEGGHFLHFFRT